MGYYSEVVVAVRKDAVEDFEASCAELLKYADEKAEFKEGAFYCWNTVKWYESEQPTASFYDWAAKADGGRYSIVRLGKDLDDMEQGGWFNCGLTVERTIAVPTRI